MSVKEKDWKDDLSKSADGGAPFVLAEKTFEPLGNLVVIQFLPRERTRGGLLIPDMAQGKVNEHRPTMDIPKAVVVSAGCQCRCVRRGDVVLVNGNWGKFEHDGVGPLWSGPENQIVGIERSEDDLMPSFRVMDWETGQIQRSDP